MKFFGKMKVESDCVHPVDTTRNSDLFQNCQNGKYLLCVVFSKTSFAFGGKFKIKRSEWEIKLLTLPVKSRKFKIFFFR